MRLLLFMVYDFPKANIFAHEIQQDDLGDRLTAAGVNLISIYGTTEVYVTFHKSLSRN